jgi:hypothetical protein
MRSSDLLEFWPCHRRLTGKNTGNKYMPSITEERPEIKKSCYLAHASRTGNDARFTGNGSEKQGKRHTCAVAAR